MEERARRGGRAGRDHGRTAARSTVAAVLGYVAVAGCTRPLPPEIPQGPTDRSPRASAALDPDDEALLASLVAEDPSDFHRERTRIWRLGSARWVVDGPELTRDERLESGTLAQPVEAVVVDDEGPRVLLPLAELTGSPQDAGIRVVAVLSPADLVPALTRELHPTPWLTLSAGVGLTPLGREDNHLSVRWSDPACGFGLNLAIDTDNFGPRYEPGPAGPPGDLPEAPGSSALRLAPGTAIYPDAKSTTPLLSLDPEDASHGDRRSAAQRVELVGKPVRGRQAITLRCRGVEVSGFVAAGDIRETLARYAVVEDGGSRVSTCAELDGEPLLIPRATPLFEPSRVSGAEPRALVGVVAQDTELPAVPGSEGWWTGCVASPWGDLLVQFRLR